MGPLDPVPHGLTPDQFRLLRQWLGAWELLADYSWPLQETTVLHVRFSDADGSHDAIVKAAPTSAHIRREIAAHLGPLAEIDGLEGRLPVLLHGSATCSILVASYLPGRLVQGSAAEWETESYRQAGACLALLHQEGDQSRDYCSTLLESAIGALPKASGLVHAAQLALLQKELDAFTPMPVRLHFTHGDYQPRNWLIDDGMLRIIDFGRAAQRPWVSDLVRLGHQQFVRNPTLQEAFFQGYGRRPDGDDLAVLRLENLTQAIATVVWAHGIGDENFEEQGRQMLDRLLPTRSPRS